MMPTPGCLFCYNPRQESRALLHHHWGSNFTWTGEPTGAACFAHVDEDTKVIRALQVSIQDNQDPLKVMATPDSLTFPRGDRVEEASKLMYTRPIETD
ncbi:uncharacterized protein PITG_00432 [Phytophthora infestans T30-4]|uniref:Uncharacterized protein n=2 Tax=Phytophthora infestans TaxID=4787 RepID=D0MQS8_PHYIT|nr:uncharacterized protein PITG_00432 [Phytophthora infestans T30-4]EEY57847.1 hypothetical protein PITG_00432 [Phytophthora infestans T30-4]KAF4033378.1 hypothetical protein GN244_ATG14713 [Phytophthora infestans]KAF4133753.1 hypothetical protein GN958_ATG17090 [Phytophthora infestans]|eukprot:XP_002909033.1 hypothetical protein PITG_00432 [Phytophthora infestans T30-4]